MALAKYFSKDLLAINRLMNSDQSAFEKILKEKVVALAFDENAIHSDEGNCGLDLIIRLLARFYPNIKIVDLSNVNDEKKDSLIALAKEINGNIEVVPDSEEEDVLILAGYTDKQIQANVPNFYFGSDNWISRYSISKSKSFGGTNNPFGSGIAACIVVSNIFRYFFSEYMDYKELDKEVELSIFSLSFGSLDNPSLEEIEFKDSAIVGIGAIGNGVIWALSKIEKLKGKIALIDDEKVSESNLQRYILFTEADEKKEKVIVARDFFKQKELDIDLCKGEWRDYINKRQNWNIDCVAIGIDNEIDRIGIQSSLPRAAFNAFTEQELIGITRHYDFELEPCVGCYYIPNAARKNRTTEVAENCGIPDKVDMVKQYYNFNADVNELIQGYNKSLLEEISIAGDTPLEKLSQYYGKKIDEFYSDYICGGAILHLSENVSITKDVDAPLAFQSAMAGIILASELIKFNSNIELSPQNRTDIHHLSLINEINPYHRSLAKNPTGYCLCGDEDFAKRFNEKWKE